MQSSPPKAPRPAQPDPFAYRQDEAYRRNVIKRVAIHVGGAHKPDWKFEMNPNQTAAPATAQAQVRLNILDRVSKILANAQSSDRYPQMLPRYVKPIMDKVENTAGPFDEIGDSALQSWEAMVIGALDHAERSINNGNDENILNGLNQIVRDSFQEFEMHSLGYNQEGYAQHLREQRTQQAMRSHPGFRPGATASVTATPRVTVVPQDHDDQAASHEAFQPRQPAQSQQPKETNMQHQSHSSTQAGPTISVTPADGNTSTHIHVDVGQAGGPDAPTGLGARLSGMAANAGKRAKVTFEDIKPEGKVKKVLKYTAGVIVVAGLSYAGYRAYKSGVFRAAARVVTEGIPNAADAIADSAQTVPGDMAAAVSGFFSK